MYYYWIDGDIENVENIGTKYGLQGRINSKIEGYQMFLERPIDENEDIYIIYMEEVDNGE